MKTTLVALLCVVAITASAKAADPKPKSPTASEAFAKLKTLAGEWRGTNVEHTAEGELTVLYKVTGNGSALVENLFSGTPHEMVTVYHLDGDKLMLTHYCAEGNQPRMVMTEKSTEKEIIFDFAGGSNMKSKKDGHMHALKVIFKNPDEVAFVWNYFKGGKTAGETKFELKRKT